jgi:hypothetical protein
MRYQALDIYYKDSYIYGFVDAERCVLKNTRNTVNIFVVSIYAL